MEPCTSQSMSYPSSPQSSALPSPPSSPGSSFSSFPSSAFSLSVPSSPPHHHSPFPPAAHSLILPSLSLDTTESDVHKPTADALGRLKLLVLGAKGSGKTFLAETLVRGNPDVLETGEWVDEPGLGRALFAEMRAEGTMADGSASVKLVEVTGFDQADDPYDIASPILDAIHAAFRAVLPLLSSSHPPDTTLRDLLASPQSRFFAAALLLTSSPATPLENALLSTLSAHIPVIPIPVPPLPHTSRPSSRGRGRPSRSTFPPLTPHQLRAVLFRRPAALRTLHCEAAERFLWWREVDRATHRAGTLEALLPRHAAADVDGDKWDWDLRLSHDVALAREAAGSPCPAVPYLHASLDPLHVPSLFRLALTLLPPLQASLAERSEIRWWAVTVVGAFCAGVGVGWVLSGV